MPSSTPCVSTAAASVDVNWRNWWGESGLRASMPQRQRPWNCGAVWVAPPSSLPPALAGERAVGEEHGDGAGAAGERGQRELEEVHAPDLAHPLDHDVVDLAGRLAGDDQPGADLAELDPVGDVDDAVEHAEAGVADVVDRGVGADAQVRRRPGRRSPARTARGRPRRRSGRRPGRRRTSAASRACRAAAIAPSESR